MTGRNDTNLPLIVGAGPVGTAAALFLARARIATRIIDVAEERSRFSKALAVNPRTLEILEPSGVTEKMLAIGLRIHGGRFWRRGKIVAEIRIDSLKHKYPFLLALSQATTERLLDEALQEAGGKVERGTELLTCRNMDDGVEAKLKHGPDASRETLKCPWLLAADGAHSAARRATQISFDGTSFADPWYLADVPMRTEMDDDFAHVCLYDDGFLFLIRVIDDVSSHSSSAPIWRLVSNRPTFLSDIPRAEILGDPVWSSDFHVSHRINAQLQVGNIYFAGDAAHVHSPIGARGMNLGVEDAWVFSEFLRTGQMQRYSDVRKQVDQRVVKRVELMSRIARGKTAGARLARTMATRWLVKIPPVYRTMLKTISGLDHTLEP